MLIRLYKAALLNANTEVFLYRSVQRSGSSGTLFAQGSQQLYAYLVRPPPHSVNSVTRRGILNRIEPARPNQRKNCCEECWAIRLTEKVRATFFSVWWNSCDFCDCDSENIGYLKFQMFIKITSLAFLLVGAFPSSYHNSGCKMAGHVITQPKPQIEERRSDAGQRRWRKCRVFTYLQL